MMRSFKYPPTFNVSDIAGRIAILVNKTEPGFFNPYDGKPYPSTKENIDLATAGQLEKHFPWWNSSTDHHRGKLHPVTGTTERYSLFDRFHEKNSSQCEDVLRRLKICPQLYANTNSESHEQLHSIMNKDNYFLNMMHPATHVFMKRLLVHLRNESKNNEEVSRQQQALQRHGLLGRMSTDSLGRLTITKNTSSHEGICIVIRLQMVISLNLRVGSLCLG